MFIVPIIIIALGALMLFWFLFEKVKAYTLKEVCLKAVTSLLFIGLAIYSTSKTGLTRFPYFAIAGLTCGLVGDVALDLKYVYKEKCKKKKETSHYFNYKKEKNSVSKK